MTWLSFKGCMDTFTALCDPVGCQPSVACRVHSFIHDLLRTFYGEVLTGALDVGQTM